jgi:hypothetical protein
MLDIFMLIFIVGFNEDKILVPSKAINDQIS